MKKEEDILLCDLDAFFAAVEQVDHPEYRGKPVIVGGNPAGRGVVSTCSYEARVFGVHSAMPMKKALQLCPEAIVIKGNMKRYAEASRQVKSIFERFTPDVEVVSIDEAYLAIEKGSGLNTGQAIRKLVRNELGLSISVGVSVNKLLAKVACELAKPDDIKAMWPSDVPLCFWPLPIKTIPGIGPATENKLSQQGIKTVGDLAKYPPKRLYRLLGSNVRGVLEFANGIDRRPLIKERDVKSVSEEKTFPEDVFDDKLFMPAILNELSAGVGYCLRVRGLAARTVTLKLRYSNYRTITRSKTLNEATDSDSTIYQAAVKLFNDHKSSPPWRLIGVKVSSLDKNYQQVLFSNKDDKEKKVINAKDSLQGKYGKPMVVNAIQLSLKKE